MRLLHILVIGALVAAAAYVYEIKFESTLQASGSRSCATKSAASATPSRRSVQNGPSSITPHASRAGTAHLKLKPVDATQIDTFGKLPERPREALPQDIDDPIGAIIEQDEVPTGSVRAQQEAR